MENHDLMISFENVSFHYPGVKPILREVHFELHDGERLGLIGPNGSGKTTFFHVIMGLLKPTEGRIEIFGREMKGEKDFRAIRQKIGYLFQDADDQLFSPIVLEDVAFGPLNQGKAVKDAKKLALDALESLGLSGFEHRVTHKLSGGEKKLVSLATVLAMKPKVLLLDEPTNGLDSETTKRIIDILKSIDIPYIFISHNMDFISRTTDKIYGMNRGRIFVEDKDVVHTHAHSHGYGQMPHTHSDDPA